MPPRNEKQQFLTTDEVARLLGYSPRTITTWAEAYVDSGGREGLPAFRFGRRAWRFDRTVLEVWIKSKYPGYPSYRLNSTD